MNFTDNLMKKTLLLIAFLATAMLSYGQISYPFGTISASSSSSDTSTISITISEQVTLFTIDSTSLTDSATINLDVSAEIKAGALLYIKALAKSSPVAQLTFGTSITGNVDTIAVGKYNYYEFIYDGSNFLEIGNQEME